MNDSWYVQKGVELVGWQWDENTLTGRKFFELPQTKREQELGCSSTWVEDNNQVGRDALAAQLVRQVDALEPSVVVTIGDRHTEVLEMHGVNRTTVRLYNRTMNTIRAIVDSKVLEGSNE